jgi:hypothetical protein
MVSETGQQITARFFEAADALVAQKKLRGVQTLAKEIGILGSTLRKLRKQPEIYTLKPEFMPHLITAYGVSAEWLLTGSGGMFSGAKQSEKQKIPTHK